MKETKTRYSKQRELILSNLQNRCDHPTAEMIYQDLKKSHPNLSLGTVYRNLSQLVESKQINKLDLGNPMVHYDANIQPHMHFICERCHQIIDIDIQEESLKKQIKEKYSYHINSIQINMTGICQNCLKDEAA